MFEPGTTVDDLRVEALKRTTSGGSIFTATQLGLGRPVTVYVADAPADSDAGRRFLADITRLATIDDSHLLPVYEVRTVDGRIAAIGGGGETRLQDLLADGPLPAEQAVAIVEQMVAAVEALERAGVHGVLPTAATVVPSADGAARLSAVEALLEPAIGETAADPVRHFAGLLASASGGGALQPVIERAGGCTTARELVAAARAALPAPSERRRRLPLAIGAAATAAAIAVVVLLLSSGSDAPRRAPANAPGARIAAVIDVGGQSRSIGVGEGGVWVGRQDRQLVRIDPATNRVVGAPIRFAPPAPANQTNVTVRVGAGAVFAMDTSGTVVRVDPKSSRITARAPGLGQILGATVAGRELWVLVGPPTKLLRFDADTLRRLGPPIGAGRLSVDVESAGPIAYLADIQGEFTRVDTRTGHVDTYHPAGQGFNMALRDGVLWIADASNGTLVQIDTDSLKRRGEVVRGLGHVITATALGDSIWVMASRDPDPSTPMRLYRIDAATGRVAGKALALGSSVGWPQPGAGALWLSADRGVIKVVPTSPEPETTPNRPAPPRLSELTGGPVTPGSHTTDLGRSRLSLQYRDDGWLATVDKDFVDNARLDDSQSELTVMIPSAVFDRHGGLVRPRSVSQVLATLRANPRLIVGKARDAAVGGESAVGVSLAVRPDTPRSDLCGQRRCLAVFNLPAGGWAAERDLVLRLVLLRHRGQIVVASMGARSAAKLTTVTSLLRTMRFLP